MERREVLQLNGQVKCCQSSGVVGKRSTQVCPLGIHLGEQAEDDSTGNTPISGLLNAVDLVLHLMRLEL